jgi:hypothetical protein
MRRGHDSYLVRVRRVVVLFTTTKLIIFVGKEKRKPA